MPVWFVSLIMLSIVAMAPGTATAANKSIGRSLGEAGRAIADGSQSAYHNSRDLLVAARQRIARGARDVFENAKHIGPQLVEDVKDGFRSNAQAPDSTITSSSATEKP